MRRFIKSLGVVGVLTALQGGLTGCQSGAQQSDAFATGVNRPPTPRTLHMMSKLLNENGRAGQAEYVLLKIIDESPNYLPAYIELADIQIRQQRYSDAAEVLSRAHALSPRDPVIANNLGVLRLRENRFDGAIHAFRAAVLADPDEARYRANLALGLALSGDYEQAYEMYATVLPPAAAFWNLGVISEARQDEQHAKAYFTKSHELKTNRKDADSSYASVPVN
jgi:Flp pilus assembly protein TadD